MKLIILIISILLIGCSSNNVEVASNGLPQHATDLEEFNSWKWEQEIEDINQIDHLLFKGHFLASQLEVYKLKGGLNCIPAQIKIAERFSKRFFAEYYNKMLVDSQTTLIKWEEQNKKINLMLKEIHYETACTLSKDMYLSEINKRIKKIEKGGIYFELDSSELSKEAIRKTKQIIYLLKDFDINSATVLGHTSDEHTLEYNYELGKKRANKVKGIFLDEGFEYNNVISRSYSKIVNFSENKSQNRRVNIRVTEDNLKDLDGMNKVEINYRIKDWDIDIY